MPWSVITGLDCCFVSSSSSNRRPQASILAQLDDEFGPSLIEEDPHVVSGFADWAVVLIENLTVAEHQVHILTKLVS